MANTAQLDSLDNPYRAPANWEPTPRGGYDDPLIVELRTFVGPNADYYLRKWAPRLEDPHLGEAGFHLPSLFVPVAWLGYRRMYKAALLLIAVSHIAGFLQVVLFRDLLGLDALPAGVDYIVVAMIHVVCALYANTWYLTHAQRALLHAHERRLEGHAMLSELSRRGGTSSLGMLAIVGLNVISGQAAGVVYVMLGYV